MPFDPAAYGSAVAQLLALDGNGQRPMPLTQAKCSSASAAATLRARGARELLPTAPHPDAALAGLYFYFNCWSEAHETAQDIQSREGSYWHALVHRQEPDSWNSAYWFRQTGSHPIYPALRDRALEIGFDAGSVWKPEAFIEFCERARSSPGSTLERQALDVQLAEWQLLFDYCAAL